MPQSKITDVNVTTLLEVINKSTGGRSNRDYLPFNKSILTRIMFEQLKSANFLVISHFSKKSIDRFLKNAPASGPAKGIFNNLLRFGFEKRGMLKNKKISNQEA